MADTKTYNVIYNITANAGEAVTTLSALAQSAEKLGNGRHMQRFNSQIKQLAEYSSKMTEAMNAFSPRVDMRTFRTQLKLMENAVSISAQNMRSMIQMALSGTSEQFDRALKGRRDWASTLRKGLLSQEKEVEKQLSNTKKEIDRISKIIKNNGALENVNGRTIFTPLSDKERNSLEKQKKVLKSQEKSLSNSLGSITDHLNVLGRTAPAAIKTSLNALGNVADNSGKLNEMAKAVNKWNKAIAGMPKNQTYKITLKAQDNTGATIEKIRRKIAQLKTEASSIFFGGAPSGKGTAKKTSNKRPADVMSSRELKNSEAALNQLKQLAFTKSNGTWSRQMAEQANALGSIAAKSLGLPADTPIEQLIGPLQKRYKQELQKYNNWRQSAINASKSNKAATASSSQVRAPRIIAPSLGTMNPAMWNPYIISSAQLPQSGSVTIGTRLDRSGLVPRMQSGYSTMQRAADARPVNVRTRLDRGGIVDRAYGGWKTLQAAADQRPIRLRGMFDQSGLRFGLGRALVELQNIANSRPIRINAVVSQNGTIPSGGAARTTSMPKPGVYPSGGGGGGSTPPPSMPGVVPSGTRRNPVNVRSIYDGGVFNATKRWLYPLTGNTSFGARTPAVVEMAKGMGMMMAVGGAMGAVGNSFSQSTDYQNMMTTTRAILGRSYKGNDFEGDISNMERIVRREGVLTKFTAPEVAGAAKYLAMAGMDINTINSAIKPVVNIALAGDVDLPTAADKMTNIMTAFGMKTPSDFTRASDVLTNTFTKSNTNMLQLAEAAQYAAPIAAMRGMKLEDMMALVGVMSDAGIQSSMAGTTLRMMMNNIYKPSKNQQVMWDKLSKLGVTRTDRNGNWLNVIDILDQISQKVPVNGKAGETLADVMSNLFRVTSAAGATQLAKNITKVKSLRDSNINSYGAAESIRDARINNVRGKWAQVSSQFTENILTIFEKPEMQQKIMDMLDKFRGILAKPETMKSLESIFDVMLSMAEFAGKMAEIGAKLVGSAPNLVRAMLQFQFITTMLGSYVITPIVQLVNTIGTLIPGLGKGGGGALRGGATATSGVALASGISMATGNTKRSVVASISRNGSVNWVTSNSARKLSAGRTAMLSGALAIAQARQIRYESLANRLNYKAIYSDHPHDEFMAALRADRHAKEAAETVAALRNRMAPVTRADAMTRYARIYGHNYRGGFWGRVGAGMSRGFNAGQALNMAMMFGGTSTFFKTGITSILTKLATGFGALLSPVGLATIAIGGLTVGLGHFLSQTEKSKERIKQIKEDAQERSNEIKKHQNKLREFGRDHINSGAKNINWWSEASSGNPQLQHESEFKNIFRRDSKTASTSKDYWETMFEMYIRPYSKYIYGQDVTWSGFKNMFPMEGMGATSPDVIRRQVEQGAVYKIISNSGQYKYASEKAMRILSDWSKLPSDQRDAKYDDVMNQLRSIRDSFDYKNGLDISGKDFKTLRYGDIGRSKQGKYAAWQLLNNLINGDDYNAKQLFAKYNISHAAPFSNNWFDSFDTILNSIVLDDFKGAILQFKNGSANWKKFADDTKKLGVDFTNTTNGHLEILTAIAKHIINDPNLKELESVRKYLEGLIRYINDFNAKEMLNRHRNMMYEWVAPTNTPITITTGEGDAPEGIRKPGNKTWNWNYIKESINTRNNGVNAAKYGVIDQTPFKPSKYEGPLSSNTVSPTNNTVNIHIDSVVGADRDSAQLFSDIVGKELVNALGIINEQYQGNVS